MTELNFSQGKPTGTLIAPRTEDERSQRELNCNLNLRFPAAFWEVTDVLT
jgi:hypothetical protein